MEAAAEGTMYRLKIVSNRGTKVYPDTGAMTAWVDHWRCRFVAQGGEPDDAALLALLARVGTTHRWMHVEKLQSFDGVAGFTKAQGKIEREFLERRCERGCVFEHADLVASANRGPGTDALGVPAWVSSAAAPARSINALGPRPYNPTKRSG
jgi:hypothetical protein